MLKFIYLKVIICCKYFVNLVCQFIYFLFLFFHEIEFRDDYLKLYHIFCFYWRWYLYRWAFEAFSHHIVNLLLILGLVPKLWFSKALIKAFLEFVEWKLISDFFVIASLKLFIKSLLIFSSWKLFWNFFIKASLKLFLEISFDMFIKAPLNLFRESSF